jgi:hypothetical protein
MRVTLYRNRVIQGASAHSEKILLPVRGSDIIHIVAWTALMIASYALLGTIATAPGSEITVFTHAPLDFSAVVQISKPSRVQKEHINQLLEVRISLIVKLAHLVIFVPGKRVYSMSVRR